MNQEIYLKEKFGSKKPFSVPENYFENLTSRIMERIEEENNMPPFATQKGIFSSPKEHLSISKRLRPLIAAASLVGIIGGASVAFHLSLPAQQAQGGTENRSVAESHSGASAHHRTAFDDSADYMMFEDDDLYAYLSE